MIPSSKCQLPPAGWSCSRLSGHEGPCAAEPIQGYKLGDDEVKAMLEKLSSHFGEPVQPIGQYCAALNIWASALRDKAKRLEDVALNKLALLDFLGADDAVTSAKSAREFADHVGEVFMQISKSNLLARLIYEGESLRTVPCPVHKGIWSGCGWSEKDENNCACQRSQDGHIGSNVTGWLP